MTQSKLLHMAFCKITPPYTWIGLINEEVTREGGTQPLQTLYIHSTRQ